MTNQRQTFIAVPRCSKAGVTNVDSIYDSTLKPDPDLRRRREKKKVVFFPLWKLVSLAVVVVLWKRPPGLDALQIQLLHHCLKRKTNTSSQLTESNVSLIKQLSRLSNSSIVQSLTGNKK